MEFMFFAIIPLMIFLFWYATTNGLDNGLYLLHKKAYKQYQKKVIGEGWSYQRYMADFCNGNIFLSVPNDNRAAVRLNEGNKNLYTVIELLQTRSDLVIRYFEQVNFTFEDFKKLNKEFNTTQPVSLEQQEHYGIGESIIEKEFENISVLPVVPKVEEAKKEENSNIPIAETDNPFEFILTDTQIEYLTDCVNDVKMFNRSVTPEELKAIFVCKPQMILRSNNNRLIAFFYSGLSDRDLITKNWQSVIANHKLFLSNDKKRDKYINQSDLSTAIHDIRDIGVEGKYAIIDKYLKQVKKH